MNIVIDEIDHIFYADVILTGRELDQLSQGLIVPHTITINRRKCHIGVRLMTKFDEDIFEDEPQEE